jgi:glycosyltransferase involved in cell wall biosynthesis
MKMLFISNIFTPHVRGGYELGCQTIAQEFQARGHKVAIASSRTFGRLNKISAPTDLEVHSIFDPVTVYEELHRHSSDTYSLLLRHEALAGNIVSNNIRLWELVRWYKPDFIWCFNPLGLGPVGILETLLATNTPFCIHLMDNIDGVIADHQQFTYSYSRWARLKRSSSAIACSSLVCGLNNNPNPYKKCAVIPNGVAFPTLNPMASRCLDNTNSNSIRLAYFGQIAPKKGILQVLKAFKTLQQLRKDLTFTLDLYGSGSPDFLTEIKNTIKSLSIAQDVTMVGHVQKRELLLALRQCDLAIMLLSGDEPFAYAPIEAAAAGLPVVLPKNVSNAEFFPKGYPLLIGDRDNASEVADIISTYADTVLKRQELSDSLFSVLKNNLDLHQCIIPAYETFILELSQLPAGHQRSTSHDSSNTDGYARAFYRQLYTY